MSLQCAVRLVCAVYPLTQNYFAYLPLSAAFKKMGLKLQDTTSQVRQWHL